MKRIPHWTVWAPIVSLVLLAATWGSKPGTPVLVVVGIILATAVLAAVHHAEVVAHRVGEPFGSLVLAVAVTVIEVALIVTLMVAGGKDTSTLARDTVFAAVMITVNGIVGISLLTATLRGGVATFNAEGTATRAGHRRHAGDAHDGAPDASPRAGPGRSSPAHSSRSPPSPRSRSTGCSCSSRRSATATTSCPRASGEDEHAPTADQPRRRSSASALLVVALVAVVGLAKVESPAIEDAVESVGRAAVGGRRRDRAAGAAAGDARRRGATRVATGCR